MGTHGLGIGPVVRIQTLGRLGQPVAFFGSAGAPRDALEQFAVPGAIARGRGTAKRPAQQRLVVDDERRGGGRFRPSLRAAPTRATAVPVAIPLPIALIGPADVGRFAVERRPVETQVWMGVFERLAGLVIERTPAHADVRGRAEQVQDAGPLRPLGRAIPVHDERGFVSALVPGVADEWHL